MPPKTLPVLLLLLLIGVLLTTNGCTSVKPVSGGTLPEIDSEQPDSTLMAHSVYLIGDAGWVSPDPLPPVLKNLQKDLGRSDKNSSVVFLGDNVYPKGLQPKSHRKRKASKQPLLAQLRILEEYKGNVIFIPGNHDWRKSKVRGLKTVRRQEKFIEAHLNGDNAFLPDSGKPGPVYRPVLNPSQQDTLLQIVALDTQWWLHPHKKSGSKSRKEESAAKQKIREELHQILEGNSSAPYLVVGHHPVYSRSTHGGYFPLKTHLLPPVFGSMYVIYRNLFGLKQDIANKEYKRMAEMLKEAFSDHKVIYASGHDHTLQFLEKGSAISNYYLISGAGSAVNYVNEPDPYSGNFGYQGLGYAAIHFYKDQSIWVEMKDAKGRLLYERKLNWQ